MNRDYLSLGPTPSDEDCIQVGTDNYSVEARKECRRFIDVIRMKCGDEPYGAELKTMSCPHDFGDYLDVVCWYDESNEDAIDYAFFVESNSPTTWPDTERVDRKELS